jgi:hypothetical protein
MFNKPKPLSRLVNYLFTSRLQEVPFIIFLSFLLTFLVTRLYIYITNHDLLEILPLIEQVSIKGTHIHHLSWGIILLAIVGFWALYDLRPTIHRFLAIMYGIGLGLTFDEFALWLMLKDNYYARSSYDAIVIISLILLNIIYFPGFWSRMSKRIFRLIRYFRSFFHFPHKNTFRKPLGPGLN